MISEFMSIKELSLYLSIKEKTLYAKVSAKEIPHYKIHRLVRFKKEEIDLWVKERKVAPISTNESAKQLFKSFLPKPKLNIDLLIKNVVENTDGKSL